MQLLFKIQCDIDQKFPFPNVDKNVIPCATVQTAETLNSLSIHSLQSICHDHMKMSSCNVQMILQYEQNLNSSK